MNLSRIGSQKVISADDTHLTVLQLPGARLNEVVTIETKDGQKLTGHITSLAFDRCEVHICDNHGVIQRDHLTVWRQGVENGLTVEPALWIDETKSDSEPFITGINAWDCLFPLSRGNRVLLSAQSPHIADKTGTTLIRAALQDGQIPVCSATRPTRKERERLQQIWQHLGLDDENLFSADSATSAYCVLRLIHDSLKRASALASAGHDVCLLITDVEAWFDLFCEDLTLQGRLLSRKAMISAFQGELCRCLDSLYQWRKHITVVVVQPWQENGKTSVALHNLRSYFDVALLSLIDGSVSLDGEVMIPALSQKQQEAALLRRQFKILIKQVQRYLLEAEDLPDDLGTFQKNLELFLSHTDPQEEPSASNEAAWKLLYGVEEDRLLRIPLSLLRDRLSNMLVE